MQEEKNDESTIFEIRTAIKIERKESPDSMGLKVIYSTHNGNQWRIKVQSMEGGIPEIPDQARHAWWTWPEKGKANLSPILSSSDMIILENATAPPPPVNGIICIDLPDFLAGLDKIWDDKEWAIKSLACLDDLATPKKLTVSGLNVSDASLLRPAQRDALSLVRYSSSFLWGPPGTGKTTTLGALIAEFLGQYPDSRVLLLSTTNFAVDEAILRVDMELEKTHWGSPIRKAIWRFGSRVTPGKFRGRTHLIADRSTITRANSSSPGFDTSPTSPALAASSDAENLVVGSMPDDIVESTLLESARLVTMTLTGAIAKMDKLRALRKFDLLVFDEASQIGLAYVLAMMPLAHIRLFAGDPIQLSPIARAKWQSVSVAQWLAQSPFVFKREDGPALCQLSEQSRMPPLVCEIVSKIFYGGRLRVADNALVNDPEWLSHKKKGFGPISASSNVYIYPILAEPKHPREPAERLASANAILSLLHSSVAPAFDNQPQRQQLRVLVVTPFKAQQKLLRVMLDDAGYKQVMVSTIHRVQGSEAEIVIFDPVDGTRPFMTKESGGPVVNVAISRARSKLIVLLSESDVTNPLFAQMNEIVNRHANRPIKPISEVLNVPGCEISAVGQRVSIGQVQGEIISIHPKSNSLTLINEVTQRREMFDLNGLHYFQSHALNDSKRFGSSQ